MLLAGFERPTSGHIRLDGKPIEALPPHRRNMGVVFQSYSLFPHMTVAQNVAFPLSVRKVAATRRARAWPPRWRRCTCSDHAQRRPQQLSGGQQQRVALARALVFEPRLVLMDEPLSALDKKLREEMQLEIRRLHRELGVTMVYVTHDQSEAMTLSDRVAVFNQGRVEQLATPKQLYDAPANPFVAGFLGDNNMIDAAVESGSAGAAVQLRAADGSALRARGGPHSGNGGRGGHAVRAPRGAAHRRRRAHLAGGEPAARDAGRCDPPGRPLASGGAAEWRGVGDHAMVRQGQRLGVAARARAGAGCRLGLPCAKTHGLSTASQAS